MNALRLSERQLRAYRLRGDIPRERRGKKWEDLLAWQLDREGIGYVREHRFLADRKYALDFAIKPLTLKVAVEVDGGVHRIKGRWIADRDKFNLATLMGWRVLHVDAPQVRTGAALALLMRLLEVDRT